MQCVINLCIQYFAVYTALAVLRTANQFHANRFLGLQQVCETAAMTVTYAPMLCVLFLGTRMRAIQLSQGETEKYDLPQPFVKTAMQVCAWAVLAQVLLVLAIPIFTGETAVTTDEDGNVDTAALGEKMNDGLVMALSAV